jgi:fucose permease
MALLADIHGERRAQAYAGQGIFAYSFGFAAPLVSALFLLWGLGWRPAALLGGILGLGIAIWYRRTDIVEAKPWTSHERQTLPPAFWAYWTLVVASCGMEYAVLLWAPAFLERVVGFLPATAATAAAGFPLGMLLGRIALGALLQRMAPRRILLASLALSLLGFVVYWTVQNQATAAVGIFILGLGIAPLFPLSTNFAVGAAPGSTDLASVRLAISYGVSMLCAPIALGTIADEVGLSLAHLALPGLVLVAYFTFVTAEILHKRPPAPRSRP